MMQEPAENTLFCDVCNMTLPNEPSMKQHLTGQKHLKLYSEREEHRRVARKCGLYVRGYPPNIDQETLMKYFSRYGNVVWTYFGNSFMLLDYSDPFDALTVLKGNHYLGGRYLTIKYRELKSRQRFSKVSHLEDYDNFNELLKNIRGFAEQVQLLMSHLEVGADRQYPMYNKVCQDLYNSLVHTFPAVQLFPFGSTITGLGFKNSDIDIYIGEVRNGENNVPFLHKIKNILLNSRRFTNCIVIANAKIPILKCVHMESGINCDINIKNMLGVCNSQLINYYLNLDTKIREVMVIIKYWAKIHKITGQNHLFTNYSLSLMMIFFLQQDPHKVPSVLLLQQDEKFFNYQDGWNGGFQPKKRYISTLHDMPSAELMANFFEFYSNFDYHTYIICPYLGEPVRKSDFQSPEQLPKYYKTYKDHLRIQGNIPLKVTTSVCVQDPFEHSRNTTPIVSESTLNIFVNFCRQGKKICTDGEGILYRLFTEEPPNIKSELLLQTNFSQFAIPMGLNVKYLMKNVDEHTTNRKQVIKEAWFNSVNSFLLIVLKDFLNFQVEETTNEDSNKNKAKRTEGQTDIHDKETKVTSYKCSAKQNLWQSRKSTLKTVENQDQIGIVNKEKDVTKQLLSLYKNVTPMENILEFEITVQQKTDPVQVLIDLTKLSSYKKTFKSFGSFFAANFVSWFETYEKELNALSL